MLSSGRQIRLTRREVATFFEITNVEPADVRTLDDLDAYVSRCKQRYPGNSYAASFLRWLIDEHLAHCMGRHSMVAAWGGGPGRS